MCLLSLTNYRVPKTPDPSGMSVILDTNQFDRIKVNKNLIINHN